MPSGSTLTVTGGTNMTQVVAGDTIGTAVLHLEWGSPTSFTASAFLISAFVVAAFVAAAFIAVPFVTAC